MLVISIACKCSGDTEPFTNGVCFVEWAANNNLMLLDNPKGAVSFTSRLWSTRTNWNLALVNARLDSRLPDRCVPEKLPQSRYRPLLITAAKFVAPVLSEPVKRWNFCKVVWNHYSLLTNDVTQSLTSSNTTNIEEAYEDFCSDLIKGPKDTSHAVTETATYRVEIRSVRIFITPSWISPWEKV